MKIQIEIEKKDGYFDATLSNGDGCPMSGVTHFDLEKFQELFLGFMIPQVFGVLGGDR